MCPAIVQEPATIVSADVLARLLEDPDLARKVYPNGWGSSPYRVLRHDATLLLSGKHGERATFHRIQEIEALQDGVAAILDHYWGDGLQLVTYSHSAGPILASYRAEGRRHLVIGLSEPLRKGEIFSFIVTRTVRHAFDQSEEWAETIVDHPIDQLSRTIVFPKRRPAISAWLESPEGRTDLIIEQHANGRTQVTITVEHPHPNQPYTVHWTW